MAVGPVGDFLERALSSLLISLQSQESTLAQSSVGAKSLMNSWQQTPRKINMDPENDGSQKESLIPGCHFQVNHVKLWEGNCFFSTTGTGLKIFLNQILEVNKFQLLR